MKYIVRDEQSKKVILETAQYKRAEDALFRTQEKSPEHIVFERVSDKRPTFELQVRGKKFQVIDSQHKKVLLETRQYKRAEDLLFRTPERELENIVFYRARDWKKMFSLTCVVAKQTLKKSKKSRK
jgi:hypothetical protein